MESRRHPLVRLIHIVQEHAHKDVELLIMVRAGRVSINVNKLKRTQQAVSDMHHPRGAKQMVASRGVDMHQSDGLAEAVNGVIEDLAETSLKLGSELHWNRG